MLARDRGNNYDVQYIKKLYNFKQAFFIEEKLIFTFFFSLSGEFSCSMGQDCQG